MTGLEDGNYTFQQAFDFRQLCRIVMLAEFFRLLGKFFTLNCRITLVCHNFRRCIVKGGHETGEVDV